MADELALIRQVETMARDAWPADERVDLGGWQLRFTHGVTRRANSVWPNRIAAEMKLSDRLDAVESFYRARKLPARYQICPAALPAHLDTTLQSRGYRADAETAVLIAETAEILLHARAAGHSHAAAETPTVEVRAELTDSWYATYCRAEDVSAVAAPIRRAILGRIADRVGFASLSVGTELAALGMGVVSDGWLGVFSVATLPERRRLGYGTAIMTALAAWAHEIGAEHSYLQVMLRNQGARNLYRRLGYRPLYHYHYRERELNE